MTPRRTLAVLALGLLAACGRVAEPAAEVGPDGDWPQWRGPSRDGTVSDPGIATDWSAVGTPRVVWSRRLGPGFSALSVADGRAVTLHADGREEVLVALDAASGATLWRLPVGKRFESQHGDGPRSTTALVDGVAYGLGSWGRLVAADAADGRELWRLDLHALAEGDMPTWGFASSPLVLGELLLVHAGGPASVVAVERATGEVAWQVAAGPGGYASPRRVELLGRPQVLSFLGTALVGLEPADGTVLWRQPWETYYDLNAADPLAVPPDRVLVASDYGTGAGLVGLRRDGDAFSAELLWRSSRLRSHWSSSVLGGDGQVYGFDKGFLVSLDPATGETTWKQRGFGDGSLLKVGERLLVLGEDGDLALVAADPAAYRQLARVPPVLDGPCRTPPALAGRWLYARDGRRAVCLDLAPPPVAG